MATYFLKNADELRQAGREEEAVAAADQAIELAPDNLQANLTQVAGFLGMRNYKDATESVERQLTLLKRFLEHLN